MADQEKTVATVEEVNDDGDTEDHDQKFSEFMSNPQVSRVRLFAVWLFAVCLFAVCLFVRVYVWRLVGIGSMMMEEEAEQWMAVPLET